MTEEQIDGFDEVFDYCPDGGGFTRRSTGAAVGTINGAGYVVFRYAGELRYGHRMSFVSMMGREPLRVVDHRNGDKSDNRWSNLREATRGENSWNAKKRTDNGSGFKGVSLHRATGRYAAYIFIGGEKRHLGYFDTAEEAFEAYCVASKELHGEFGRVG